MDLVAGLVVLFWLCVSVVTLFLIAVYEIGKKISPAHEYRRREDEHR